MSNKTSGMLPTKAEELAKLKAFVKTIRPDTYLASLFTEGFMIWVDAHITADRMPDMFSELDRLTADLTQEQQTSRTAAIMVKNLSATIEERTAERDEARSKVKTLTEDLKNVRADEDGLSADLISATTEIYDLKEEIEDLTVERDQLRNWWKGLLRDAAAEHAKREAEKAALAEADARIDAQVTSLIKEKQRIQNLLNEAQAVADAREEIIKARDERISELLSDLLDQGIDKYTEEEKSQE